ncbi:hypothetical protein ANAEL_01076 [Anaerolineales bacterium]|nr:hypothetical protein ANAEL_01076 [Anaerolineales bacterium]
MSGYEKAVFISYAWGEDTHEREAIVNQLDLSLQRRGVTIIRDKRDLGYKGMIRDFMKRIGEGYCVIVVISDKYLRSKNCMFELVEIAANKDFSDRIFPIVLADAKIYEATDRIDYLKYWEQKKTELNEKMRGLSDLAHITGISEELNDYDNFRDEIDRLTTVIKNMNTLSPDILKDSDFQQLYDALAQRMGPVWAASRPSTKNTPPPHRYLMTYHSVPTCLFRETLFSPGASRTWKNWKRHCSPLPCRKKSRGRGRQWSTRQ